MKDTPVVSDALHDHGSPQKRATLRAARIVEKSLEFQLTQTNLILLLRNAKIVLKRILLKEVIQHYDNYQ